MQRQAREQNKKSTPGEISDPFTVLNDSIAAKNRPSQRVDYIPSEKGDKTTTVDAIDPLSDPDPEIVRTPRNGNGPRRVRNPRENGFNNNPRENGFSNRPRGDENYRNGNRTKELEENPPPNEKSECGVKCLFRKLLSFLGFGSGCKKSCSCQKNSNPENRERHSRTGNRYANSRGGRSHARPPQNKFK